MSNCNSLATHTADKQKLCKEHASVAKRTGSLVSLIIGEGVSGTCQWNPEPVTEAAIEEEPETED